MSEAIDTNAIDLSPIQDSCQKFISEVRDETYTLFQLRGEDTEIDNTLRELTQYISERSQSVSLLTSWQKIWDAEIVLRALYEASSKLWFICYQEPSQREQLVAEFWEETSKANNNKIVSRAENAFQASQNFGSAHDQRLFRIFSNESLYPKSEKNKKDRRAILNKWSFGQIMEFLEVAMRDDHGNAPYQSLLHMHGLMSHIAHADNVGLSLVIDRRRRPYEEGKLLEASNICRIFGDLVSFWWFNLIAIRTRFQVETTQNDPMWSEWSKHMGMSKNIRNAFEDTQDTFYEYYNPT